MSSSSLSIYDITALRSRLVSKLVGVPMAQLQAWHATDLQPAHTRPGRRGVPRLYSWRDYQRLCVMASLKERGISTAQIRTAVRYLDELFPDWHLRALHRYEGGVAGFGQHDHVAVDLDRAGQVLATAGGQISFREALAYDAPLVATEMAASLQAIERKGPLFALNEFDDVVVMHPETNVGLPTVRGHQLETGFIAGVATGTSVSEAAALFGLSETVVGRVVAFQRKVAA